MRRFFSWIGICGVFKEREKVCLSSLLKCHDSSGPEARVGRENLRNFMDKLLEKSHAVTKPEQRPLTVQS
jgi:hypothetical protein